MVSELPTGTPRRANRSLDTLHAALYFAPEQDEELIRVGLRPGRMCYFASRSAPMGAVTAGVTAATFYNFNPELVARFIPRAWGLAAPEVVLDARLIAADRMLRRLLGDEVVDGPEVAEAAELARAATVGLDPVGRPLYAGHAALAWPQPPHLVLWHAITLLREYRGDGHIVALVGAQLRGLDALITHTLTGRGFTIPAAQATRGWTEEDWAAGLARLRAGGLVDDEGLTAAGQQLRADLEERTDALSSAPWLTLGMDGTTRLIELGRELSRRALAAGAFPPGVMAA